MKIVHCFQLTLGLALDFRHVARGGAVGAAAPLENIEAMEKKKKRRGKGEGKVKIKPFCLLGPAK